VNDPRRVLDDFGYRPVRDSFAVGEALAPVDVAAVLESADELQQQSAFPDSGRAQDDRDTNVALLENRVAER
jgi:hypothetical protein